MSSLTERIELLESDLKAVPPRISVYHDLPFAILRYDPAEEWELRREIKLLATRLEAAGKEVHLIPMSEFLWRAIDETEGMEEVVELERQRGLHRRPGAGHDLPVQPDLETAGEDARRAARRGSTRRRSIVFLTRAAAMAPGDLLHVEAARRDARQDPCDDDPDLSRLHRGHDRAAVHGPQGPGGPRQLPCQDLRLKVTAMKTHRRPALQGPRPQDRGDHPGRSGRRAVGPCGDHRVRRHRQHPGPVRPTAEGHRRRPDRGQRERRRLGLGVLRLRQEFVRQEPRLCPQEPQGPGRRLRHALQAAARRRAGRRLARPHQRQQLPTEVILFEVAKERDTRRVTERIAELMYTVLLRELGYAEDFDIAELEIELEGEGKLDRVRRGLPDDPQARLEDGPKGRQKLSRASAVLHHLDPDDLPLGRFLVARPAEPGCGDHRQQGRGADLRADAGRRRPGKALVFIIDEVGQHVARSGDKIEDLRATVEEFGKVGKNLLKARKILAPCWIVVTSQEKLDEVVAAIETTSGSTWPSSRIASATGSTWPRPTSGRSPPGGCWRRRRTPCRSSRSYTPRTRAL